MRNTTRPHAVDCQHEAFCFHDAWEASWKPFEGKCRKDVTAPCKVNPLIENGPLNRLRESSASLCPITGPGICQPKFLPSQSRRRHCLTTPSFWSRFCRATRPRRSRALSLESQLMALVADHGEATEPWEQNEKNGHRSGFQS